VDVVLHRIQEQANWLIFHRIHAIISAILIDIAPYMGIARIKIKIIAAHMGAEM
jgi:hypothetical protein